MFLPEQMILRASVYNMSVLIFHNLFYKYSATFSGLQMNTYAQWDGKSLAITLMEYRIIS